MSNYNISVSGFDNYDGKNDSSLPSYSFPIRTAERIQSMIPLVLQGNWSNLSLPLSEWQKTQLKNLSEPGVRCLLDMWFINKPNLTEDKICNATWDNVYCWPPTPNGTVASRPCSEVLLATYPNLAHNIQGKAVRVCLDNGTWLWDQWTNYTECADSYDEYARSIEEERKLVVSVQFILFIGSIFSAACLSISLIIFSYFKCLRCDRVTVHIHLMLALLLRSLLLIIITEPFVLNRAKHYRHVDWICKAVLSTNLYATVASINWMFIQGVYLHGKLTTNVFNKGTPFRVYYIVGWVFPLGLIIVYATVLETFHPVQCWKDYSERSDIWILLGPMIFALLANLLFLINIMRILLTKVQRPSTVSDSAQLRRAVKATFVLFPLLGINHLLFLYNPGGDYNKFFVILNAVFGSTQGISVSVLYCFVNKDVRDAIRRLVQRYTIQRTANSRRVSNSGRGSVVIQSLNRSRTYFRTKFGRERETERISGGERTACNSSSPELEMVHQLLDNTPSAMSPSGDRCRIEISHDNFAQPKNMCTTLRTNQQASVAVAFTEV